MKRTQKVICKCPSFPRFKIRIGRYKEYKEGFEYPHIVKIGRDIWELKKSNVLPYSEKTLKMLKKKYNQE